MKFDKLTEEAQTMGMNAEAEAVKEVRARINGTLRNIPQRLYGVLLSFFINVDNEWWDYVYDDAKAIGLQIDGFDIERRNISGTLFWDIEKSIKAIYKNHGKVCNTYKVAKAYKKRLVVEQVKARINGDDENGYNEEWVDFEAAYRDELLECYLSMLRDEFSYLTSREAIVESIEVYDFDEDGNLGA